MKFDDSSYELFLYTIDVYKRLVGALPIDQNLASFGIERFADIGNLVIDDAALAAVSMRLMLQRKYFSRDKDLFLKGLLKNAVEDERFDGCEVRCILKDLELLHSRHIDIAFGDAEVTEGLFSNAEEMTYGALLHADKQRTEYLVSVPDDMKVLVLAPYVAGRESLLLRFERVLLEAGMASASRTTSTATIISYDPEGHQRAIANSPYWTNLRGRDVAPEELDDVVKDMTNDERQILLVVFCFIEALAAESINMSVLRMIVSSTCLDRWGDFSGAANALSGEWGISLKVCHQEDGTALVKLLPNVNEPSVIEGPQVIENGHEIVLVKEDDGWKIWAMR